MNPNVANQNGRPRRSLNDTISRLDEMIDGLSNAIPETIRDTLKESVSLAVAEGVRTALVEVLTNAEVMARLVGLRRAAHRPSPVPLRERVRQVIQRARQAVSATTRTIRKWVSASVHAIGRSLKGGWNLLGRGRRVRIPLLIAAAAGVGAVTVTVMAPAWVGAVLSGIGGMATAAAVQAGLWMRRTFRPLLDCQAT